MPKRCTFPKEEKLKSKKGIELLFSEGKSISSFPLKLIYIPTTTPQKAPVQTGVAVSKKRFKSAVTRNRIKRLLRESYRLHKHIIFNNIEGKFAFLFLYLGKELPTQQLVTQHMIRLLQQFLAKHKDD
ncbi:ribonuclease P protein component [Arenibacter sp. GZD96]|uniref:ribonuclease P protein component n=1 Tax=Aurantibrevibacter litoralis TaxID=3106030 RepID=UPI002B0002D1|nr:ribonuclease P protein component [Arenibacter sp. GZD-96]MEA1786589.1 ribonuclease P protein component [Arenibacter sp. GZD-96]